MKIHGNIWEYIQIHENCLIQAELFIKLCEDRRLKISAKKSAILTTDTEVAKAIQMQIHK